MDKRTLFFIGLALVLGCGGLLLFFIFLPTLFLILFFYPLLLFVNPPVFLFSVVVVIAIISYFRQRNARRKRVREEEKKESMSEGGIEEPHAIRELTEQEKEELNRLVQNSKGFQSSVWFQGTLALAILIVFYFALKNYFGLFSRSFFWFMSLLPFVLGATVLLVFASVRAISNYFKRDDPYYDLRAPVFRVQGRLIKEESMFGERKIANFIVRGIKISNQDLIKASHRLFKDGDEVVIEYSPRTGHVWKFHKTEDLK